MKTIENQSLELLLGFLKGRGVKKIAICRKTGINKNRMAYIENGGGDATLEELESIVAAYPETAEILDSLPVKIETEEQRNEKKLLEILERKERELIEMQKALAEMKNKVEDKDKIIARLARVLDNSAKQEQE